MINSHNFARSILDEMNLNINNIATVFLALFFTIDIFGALPMIVDLRKKAGKIDALRASLISLTILIVFLFFGESVLKFIGVDINSFAIAGAIVLFFIALEMILGIEIHRDIKGKTASIIPLAFPIIAGTGSMTTVLSFRSMYSKPEIVIAIFLNILVVYIVLSFSQRLERKLGEDGLAVMRKVFGVILLAICVKIFTTNLAQMFTSFNMG